MPNINIFNTTNENLRIIINQGSPLMTPGTGQNWQPNYVPAPYNQSYPSPGVFGLGSNYLVIATDYSNYNLMVDIPGNRPLGSLQLYIFMGQSSPSWILLENGRVISGRLE